MGWWAVVIGIILLIAALPTGWYAIVNHRENTRRDRTMTVKKSHYSGWDWFWLKYGHWMLWTLFTFFIILGGGLIYVFFTM